MNLKESYITVNLKESYDGEFESPMTVNLKESYDGEFERVL